MIDMAGAVLFEDNHVLVAVKPPNMLSQADRTGDPDILTLLKAYLKEKYHKPGNVYLGLVQRQGIPVRCDRGGGGHLYPDGLPDP